MIHRFGEFELDEELFELRKAGVPVAIQPQALHALAYLVSHHQRVVTKDELIDATWQGMAVGDGSLSQAIWVARKALGDDAEEQPLIKTIRGVGFRFVAPVTALGSAEPEAVQLPEVTELSPRFVGRRDERTTIQAAIDEARKGKGGVVFVAGEPGIGKTSLVQQAAVDACAQKFLVAWGRCWEGGGATAFLPWVQVVRACLAAVPATELPLLAGPLGQALARIFPELSTRLRSTVRRRVTDGPSARLPVFAAATSFFVELARRRPLLLVLDDLHAADEPSLSLLSSLADAIAAEPLLVLATYRDTEAHASAALGRHLRRASSGDGRRRIALGGLSRDEVADLVLHVGGPAVAKAPVVDAVFETTGGNPFLVDGLTRAVVEEGGAPAAARAIEAFRMPERAAAAVRRAVAPLPERTRRLVAVAALLGRELELPLLCRVADLTPAAALDALGPAIDARLLQQASAGRLRFSHALVQATLEDDLAPAERLVLHARAGDALVAMRASSPERPLSQIAHHFSLAAAGGRADDAVAYERDAARAAASRLAYEAAVSHLRRALSALDLTQAGGLTTGETPLPPPQASRRVDLLLELGEALRCAGEMSEAIETFDRAGALARTAGDVEFLGHAADGHAASQQNIIDPAVGERLDEALGRLPVVDSALRSRLLARLARATTFSPDWQRPETLGREGVEVARRLSDPATLALALGARRWSMRFAGALETLAISTEAVEVAREAGDLGAAAEAMIWKACDLMDLGRMREVDETIEAHRRAAEELRQPWHLVAAVRFRAMLALLQGRFQDAEALTQDALVKAEAIGDQNGQLLYAIHMTVLRREEGRFEAIEPFARAMIAIWSWNPAWRCVLTLMLADVGRHDEARAELALLAKDDFAGFPPDMNILSALANVSEACALLGDAHHAAMLYPRFSAHASRNIVIGGPALCTGPVTRFLGMLAATLGRHDEAFAHFDDAIARCETLGARPWQAHTRHQYACSLLQRGAAGDADRARDQLREAAATARELGMTALLGRLGALQAGVAGS